MELTRRTVLAGAALAGAAAAAPAWAVRADAAPGSSLLEVRMDAHLLPRLLAEFDVTEHAHDGWVQVVARPGDRARLRAMGAAVRVVHADLTEVFRGVAAREAELAAAAPQTRQAYRTYAEHLADLDRLATIAPQVVRRFALPTPTHEGRTLQGVVLGTGGGVADGRPTALMCGLHHAREWPSGELTTMFAEDLVDGFLKGDARSVDLLSRLRLIVIPVSNPDGFVRSREALPYLDPRVDTAVSLAQEGPYHRKNLRKNNGLPVEPMQGVDTNRNYPYAWGGVGASSSTTSQTYFGPAPGSEPEVVAMTTLFRGEHVLTAISNHTSGDLVLRPWGWTSTPSPDEAVLKALGDRMASRNGYTSGLWNVALYPGTGIVDDWSYGTLGTLCYTLEHGEAFHAAYGDTVPPQYAKNRPAYLDMLDAALDEDLHGVLEVQAPAGTTVTVSKTVQVPYSRAVAGQMAAAETSSASLVVGDSGTLVWHVNPSPTAASLRQLAQGAIGEEDLERYTVVLAVPGGGTTTSEVLLQRGDRVLVTPGDQ